MILKVKAANPEALESWRFFDGVEGLHYSRYPMWPTEQVNQLPVEPVEPASDVQRVYFATRKYSSPVVVMCFHSETTGNIEVMCDTEAYLLNDQGRTIERLI